MIISARLGTGAMSIATSVLLVGGCSSSGNAGAGTPAASAGAARSPGPSTPTGASPPAVAAPTGGGVPADPATARQVGAAFETFFAATSTSAQSEAALQHGSAFRPALDQQAKSAYADKSAAKVTAVRVDGALAFVTFTISSNGAALLPDAKGYAVREDGHWKVAASTFCELLRLQGGAPPACKDTTITALPH